MPTFVVLLLAYVLSQFYRAFLAIVAGDLTRDLGLDAAALGSISAAWFAAFAIAQFPVGWALDRFGPRRTIAGFMMAAIIGAGLLAAAQSYRGCLVAMALIGVGCSPVLMGSLYYFGRVHPAERFAMFSSVFIGLGSLGNLAGATPLALGVDAFGWRASMGIIAGITALSALLALVLVRDPPPVGGKVGTSSVVEGLREIASIRSLWPLLPLTFVSYSVVIALRSLWIAPYFADVHGFDVTQTGHAAFVMAGAMTVGALAYGPIERALGDPKLTTLVGSAATTACLAALGFAGHGSAAWSVALMGLIGAAGMTYGILMAHGRLFFPPHLLGRGVTFMNFAFIAGAGVVQWLSGMFVQAARDAGTAPLTAFGHLHLALAGVLLVATLIYATAPARPRPASPASDPRPPRRGAARRLG